MSRYWHSTIEDVRCPKSREVRSESQIGPSQPTRVWCVKLKGHEGEHEGYYLDRQVTWEIVPEWA